MDLDYVLRNPHRLPMLIEHQRIRCTPVSSGATGTCQRLTFDDGQEVFAKFASRSPTSPAQPTGPAAAPGFMAAEANGLRSLGEATDAVAELWAATDELIVTDWISPGPPTEDAARRLGRELACVHQAGMPTYGAPWPGFIGALPMDNREHPGPWATWFAERRLCPYLRPSVDNGALDVQDAKAVEALIDRLDQFAPPPEPIARLHGDLWPGNVLWGTDAAWLIDPAVHGGSRESDIASLHLFGGLPHVRQLLAGYEEIWPLASGWHERLGIHQLFLLLVHAALFGRSYRASVMAVVNGYLR
ncbi:fructosamine kinase family protein [Natronoglycomyces albus]|uniref:Fructosamine kinase family protein n=1 Tax=Natronoglycomyces albus TaxID=2811108 RepID=A0A895XQI9_9ACTN|nr:fructosamine kinase family protein [Natronoglycomyces albus]QSB05415.1 fructosamine kinase family protein [Natronoglycomyces albus]